MLLPACAAAQEANVTVHGMVCSFCTQSIKRTFAKMPQVEEVTVDLDKKRVSLKFKKDQRLTDEEIEAAIKNAGYEAVRIDRIDEETPNNYSNPLK